MSLLTNIKYSYARAWEIGYISQWNGDFFFLKRLQVCYATVNRSIKLLDNVGFIVEWV